MVQAMGSTYSLTLEGGKKEFCDLFLLSFFKELFLLLRTCLCECISHMPVKSRKGVGSLGAGVTDGCEPFNMDTKN